MHLTTPKILSAQGFRLTHRQRCAATKNVLAEQVASVLTRSRGSLPVRVRNRCPMVPPAETGLCPPVLRSSANRQRMEPRAGPPAQGRGVQRGNGQATRMVRSQVCVKLSSGGKCSRRRRRWLPIGHRFRTRFSRWSENQGLSCGCSQCPMVPGRDHELSCVNSGRCSNGARPVPAGNPLFPSTKTSRIAPALKSSVKLHRGRFCLLETPPP